MDTRVPMMRSRVRIFCISDKGSHQAGGEIFANWLFLVVSRAFQVLSDPDKKAKFDRFGGDPDSRFPGASAAGASSPFGNFARSSGGRPGPMFEEELTPEDLFRQFFGGGGAFGGPFGMIHSTRLGRILDL
jgi:DnaJ-class molecular chaperone